MVATKSRGVVNMFITIPYEVMGNLGLVIGATA